MVFEERYELISSQLVHLTTFLFSLHTSQRKQWMIPESMPFKISGKILPGEYALVKHNILFRLSEEKACQNRTGM